MRTRSSSGVGDESYMASVSDLMVGLLFVFIILLMAFALSYRNAEAENQEQAAEAEEETTASRAEKRDYELRAREAEQAKRGAEAQAAALLTETRAYERRAHEADRARRDAEAQAVALLAEKRVYEQRAREAGWEREQARREADAARRRAEHADERARLLETVTSTLTNDGRLREQLLRSIERSLQDRGVRVTIDVRTGTLRLPESLLFSSGSAIFSAEGVDAVEQLGLVLSGLLPCYAAETGEHPPDCPEDAEPRLETMLIEGHTDDVPISTARFENNWDLAVARSLGTYRAIVESAPSLDTLRNVDGQPILSVAAYEARRPADIARTPEARRLNRRIDLRFIMTGARAKALDDARRVLEQSR